jgi:membrane fusion protein (multidrug efflux system)
MKRICILLNSLVLLGNMSCSSTTEEEAKDLYTVTNPIRKDTSTTREYVCQIHAIQHIELRALESGYLEAIYVDEGKTVKKGQLMFQILPIQYKAEFQKAQAEVNYAQIEYQNAKMLSDSNVVSPVQLALEKAKLEKSKAELELARVHLSFTEIKAPFDGLMDHFYVRLGSLLNDGDLLTTLSDISTLWVYFNVPEAEYLSYKKGMKKGDMLTVKLRTADHEMFNQIGIVKTIEADFNNKTGNIAFRATFPNPDGLLRHGETGNVVVTAPLKNALIIPQKATFEVLDHKYVYVVDKDNLLKTRRVIIETEIPDLYVIKEGLSEKDKILLEGIRKVKEGDKISYKYNDPKQVIAHLKLHAE